MLDAAGMAAAEDYIILVLSGEEGEEWRRGQGRRKRVGGRRREKGENRRREKGERE